MFNIFKFSLIKTNQKDIEAIKSSFNPNIEKPWDPINQIDIISLKNNIAKILATFNSIKQNSNKPKKQRFYTYLIAIFGTILLFFLNIPILILFILPFIPLVYVYGYYSNLSKEIIKIQIAKENDYFYNPIKSYNRWSSLSGNFPEIFKKGNENRYVEDEFFGKISRYNKEYNFYSGLFSYTINNNRIGNLDNGRGNRQNRIRVYKKNFFSIKLDKTLNSRFHLYHENIIREVINFFSKKNIEMASNNFNKTFAFSYNGKKDEKALEIVKILSPAVQTRLLDLNKEKRGMEILFSKGCVFFMFNDSSFKKIKTNLFKSCEISSEDKKYIQNQLEVLIDLSIEIVKYLD